MYKTFSEIVQYNDRKKGKVLREVSKEVKRIDNDVKNVIADLITLAKANSKDGITLVGLSAPQVGWAVSVFVYYDLNKKQYIEVINPKVTYSSKEMNAEWEGCASIGIGATSLFAPVKRSRSCQIRFLDMNGKEQFISVSNYQSHILQHEIDHLNGILFLDKVSDPRMIYTAKELDEYAKKHDGDYPPIK